jgi:hypothetical protein
MKIALAALGLLTSLGLATAQTSSSQALGYNIYTYPAGASTSINCFPLYPNPIFVGTVTGVTSNELTVAGATFASGSLSTAASPYFVVLTSSPQAGRSMRITANSFLSGSSSNVLTVDTGDNTTLTTPLNLSGYAVVPNEATVQIFPAYTLNTLFGTTPTTLQFINGGATATAADSVAIYNATARKFDEYFFNTTLNIWNRVGGGTVNAGNTIIYPESAPRITRKLPNSPTSRVEGLAGMVPVAAPLLKMPGNATVYSGFRLPVPVLLSWTTTAPISLQGWTSGSSFAQAPAISVLSANSLSGLGYFLNSATTSWYTSSGAPAYSISVVGPEINPTAGVIYVNRVTGSTFPFIKFSGLPYPIY